MTDTPSALPNLTPESAKQLPDKELGASREQAEQSVEAETDEATVAEAEEKAALAENEMKRRGTAD